MAKFACHHGSGAELIQSLPGVFTVADTRGWVWQCRPAGEGEDPQKGIDGMSMAARAVALQLEATGRPAATGGMWGYFECERDELPATLGRSGRQS